MNRYSKQKGTNMIPPDSVIPRESSTPGCPAHPPHPKKHRALRGTHAWIAAAAILVPLVPMHAAPPELKTQGNQIVVKSTGTPVRLTGVNIPSLEWSPYQGENLATSTDYAIDVWHANVIRLPVHQTTWLNSETYRQKADGVINQASAKNAYVILDLHGYGQPNNAATTFWTNAANRYKNNPAVLFGIFNEPHGLGWEVWKNGNSNGPGMQALVNTVRATGANNIVLVGGGDWAYDLSGILNGYALTDSTGNGIVYDTHIYPWKSGWQLRVGNVAQQFPVLVGELGHPGGTTYSGMSFEHHSTWVPKVMEWVDTHNLHWTGWSLHPSASPCLISNWSYTPTAFWGATALKHLQSYANPSSERVIGGTVIGTPGTRTNPGSGVITDPSWGAVSPFNGGYQTYFDAATASNAWTGLDLGTPHRITKIKYMPRLNYGSRMVGGVFQGSNDPNFSSGVTNLLTITSAPTDTELVYTTGTVSNTGTYRYVRYLGPANAYCNVTSILFYTGDGIGNTTPGTDVIVDNGNPSSTPGFKTEGTWASSTGAGGYYGSNYYHDNNTGKGTKSARFTPHLSLVGDYEVFARWTAHSNRASNVPIDIIHANGTEFIEVDQKTNGGQWVSLGVYPFSPGTSSSVLISNDGTNGYVVADAVRLVRQASQILDNTSAGVTITGSWTSTTGGTGPYYGSDALHDQNSGKGSKSVRFTPTISEAGTYEVFTRWTSHSNRASNVPIDIIHAGGTTTVTVNQQQNPGVWMSLGTYNFNTGTNGSVLIRTTNTNGYVIADAVSFIKQ
jgi:hypothetical protein